MKKGRIRRASDEQLIFDTVIALCRDYERRCRVINERSATRRVLMEYHYINNRIYDGAAEIVGEREAELFIFEIGERIGYARSESVGYTEITYKSTKRDVKISIAVKLHLMDRLLSDGA